MRASTLKRLLSGVAGGHVGHSPSLSVLSLQAAGAAAAAGPSAPPTPVSGTLHDAGGASASAAPPPPLTEKSKSWMEPMNLTPPQVVEALSQHIVGQTDAKKAIAVALRNRWRRMRLSAAQQAEIIPKNILMVSVSLPFYNCCESVLP